jgi:hypothetical protein
LLANNGKYRLKNRQPLTINGFAGLTIYRLAHPFVGTLLRAGCCDFITDLAPMAFAVISGAGVVNTLVFDRAVIALT